MNQGRRESSTFNEIVNIYIYISPSLWTFIMDIDCDLWIDGGVGGVGGGEEEEAPAGEENNF